jgi:hypothetical protein
VTLKSPLYCSIQVMGRRVSGISQIASCSNSLRVPHDIRAVGAIHESPSRPLLLTFRLDLPLRGDPWPEVDGIAPAGADGRLISRNAGILGSSVGVEEDVTVIGKGCESCLGEMIECG